jgi:4a-hydroxytetrahydrobiopterin dehydratase
MSQRDEAQAGQPLAEQHCKPCEGGVAPLDAAAARAQMKRIDPAWTLDAGAAAIRRSYQFRDFYRTMSFVNAVAYVANAEDHHPDLELGYNYCRVRFTTHAIKGLSENDFICAAKVDRL